MNDIIIYKNEQFGEIRTMERDGEIWFVGKDVAEVLGYKKTENALAKHVDTEDKTLTPIQGGCSTGSQKTYIINESGLYSLILSSKLPQEKEFIQFLLDHKLVYRNSHRRLVPYAEGRKNKWFEVSEFTYTKGSETTTSVQTKITPTGRQKIHAMMAKKGM